VPSSAERIARSHHERWDGSGYPDRLSGQSIPLEARIVAVADFLDALTHNRPYRTAWTVKETVDAISAGSGSAIGVSALMSFTNFRRRLCQARGVASDVLAVSQQALDHP
jgi:putative two-component system response regulator